MTLTHSFLCIQCYQYPFQFHINLQKKARFCATKIFNIFLLISQNHTIKGFYQISIKLPLGITIQDATYEIFSSFKSLLIKQNAPFSIVEDPTIWEIRIAKKTGQPKDYIPAIDPQNLVKSVECYDSLVLNPIKQQDCIQQLISSSIVSNPIQIDCNASNSPSVVDESKGSLNTDCNNNSLLENKSQNKKISSKKRSKNVKKIQLSSFEKDSNNSTQVSSNENKKSFKTDTSHYSTRGFSVKEDDNDDVDTLASSRANYSDSSKDYVKIQEKRNRGFFFFLCC